MVNIRTALNNGQLFLEHKTSLPESEYIVFIKQILIGTSLLGFMEELMGESLPAYIFQV